MGAITTAFGKISSKYKLTITLTSHEIFRVSLQGQSSWSIFRVRSFLVELFSLYCQSSGSLLPSFIYNQSFRVSLQGQSSGLVLRVRLYLEEFLVFSVNLEGVCWSNIHISIASCMHLWKVFSFMARRLVLLVSDDSCCC